MNAQQGLPACVDLYQELSFYAAEHRNTKLGSSDRTGIILSKIFNRQRFLFCRL